MDHQDLPTNQLSYLMGVDDEPEELWSREELGAIFAHQLAAPIAVDLPGHVEADSPTTFADVLFSESPDWQLLEAIKQFSKGQSLQRDQLTLPKSVTGALYMCSIAAALVHAQRRITTLENDDLKAKLDWVSKQSWLDDRCNELILAAIGQLPG